MAEPASLAERAGELASDAGALAHNLELLANLDRIRALGFKTMLGVSRKRFLKAIDPSAVEASDRLGGSDRKSVV